MHLNRDLFPNLSGLTQNLIEGYNLDITDLDHAFMHNIAIILNTICYILYIDLAIISIESNFNVSIGLIINIRWNSVSPPPQI